MRQGIPSLLIPLIPCLVAFSISSEEATLSSAPENKATPKAETVAATDTKTTTSDSINKSSTPEQSTGKKDDEQEKPTVLTIDNALFEEHSRLEEAKRSFKEQKNKVDNTDSELTRLTAQAKALDKSLDSAKASLKAAYDKMLTVPDYDITSAQKSYQQIWSDVKQNQQSRLELQQTLTEEQSKLSELKSKVSASQSKIDDLEKSKKVARAQRLYEELSVEHEEKVSFTNRCSPNMTLKQCEDQTVELGLQKTVNQFRRNLLQATTESELVTPNSQNVSMNIHVLNYDVLDSGFQNKDRYRVVLQGLLQSKVSRQTACKLLSIENQYCSNKQPAQNQKEVAWFKVEVRSNQYDDAVFIDGVSYGKSPVEVSLAKGSHKLTVKKDGFLAYETNFTLNSDTTVRAHLKQKGNPLKTGFKFKDAISKGASAPEVITVAPGNFYLGEYNSVQYKLDHAFAISSTPVTVSEFETFVKSTNYKTDAELTKSCLVMKNDRPEPNKNTTWKAPGFSQSNNQPVVCITQKDAKKYANWLSQKTGANYRLPTEAEWEIASRGGKTTAYWWGSDFQVGKANTGWSGTAWSNKSTSPVTAFKPNPIGMYDAVGNVWEWTNSPQGATRGGAWCYSPSTATVFSQLYVAPATAANYIGFRVLREIH
ncbi:formylglycine-generating enzyme family protein [Vibrio viridaestus]|uniref:PEGA domain-containing protein n=1 Tax=Vibrio viridaestus TaxID=2487322 RepID=A0A3N9TN17_9VIBR|nr:formylglycine-generating enzyme family protein [Vibrio viridaestus]RQW65045.1 PEGA domain-containing protein [Vibrio viridaestus]